MHMFADPKHTDHAVLELNQQTAQEQCLSCYTVSSREAPYHSYLQQRVQQQHTIVSF
jgi:hypothetical protein